MAKKYLSRICDSLLLRQLASSGAVLIDGAKWCGKTSTARQVAKSVLYMQDTDRSQGYLKMADTMPSRLLLGDNPRLLDEWQMAPVLWDTVRFEVDKRSERGLFILTGSSVPKDGVTAHTGTGRISRLLMRPMSLFESEESNGSVSLERLFAGDADVVGESKLTVPDLAQIICRGGWPEAVVNGDSDSLVARNYVDAVINMDVQRVDDVERNPARVRQFLRSYARNISTMAPLTTVLADVKSNDTVFSDTTLYSYVNALRRIFLIEDIPAWKPSLRSKTAIRTSDKRQFVDPSIATALMHVNVDSLLDDMTYFGFLFESLAARDLRIYAQALDGDIFHYHDKSDLEADLVIRLHDGRWAPVEVKLGSSEIEEGAAHLIKLQKKIDTEKVGQPSFKMVLTGGQFAYKRNDGVLVVPIGCLKP
ncbi:ATPase [Bacteroidales bacterium CF]|nr:ATPase [Bacteroidales bacterium CF]